MFLFVCLFFQQTDLPLVMMEKNNIYLFLHALNIYYINIHYPDFPEQSWTVRFLQMRNLVLQMSKYLWTRRLSVLPSVTELITDRVETVIQNDLSPKHVCFYHHSKMLLRLILKLIHRVHKCFVHGVYGFMLGAKLIKWSTTVSAQGETKVSCRRQK